MSYLKKRDITFLIFMNRKYKDYEVNFEFVDDYLIWLYEKCCRSEEIRYYQTLEEDLIEYIHFQTGKERDLKGKILC